MTQRLRSSRAFTLWELLAILVIVAITAAILFPIFARPRRYPRQQICSSNLKQVGLALLAYTQDYDEKFPPAVSRIRTEDGSLHEQEWGITTSVTIQGRQMAIPGLISSFVKTDNIFQCPLAKPQTSGLNHMYSDLTASESQSDFTGVARTIIVAEGEDHLRNVGHAKSQKSTGDTAILSPHPSGTGSKLLLGAAVGDASGRHAGGVFYLFADGHVKWLKPEAVFFPPRDSNSSSHRETNTGKLLGPELEGATQDGMTFQGKVYKATFHVR